MVQGLRSWFLRDVLESLERARGSMVLDDLAARAPDRLRPHLSLPRLRSSGPTDVIPIDEGEELLLAIDAIPIASARTQLEAIAVDQTSRQLSQGRGAVQVGDLTGTVARLRTTLERPFAGLEVLFSQQRTERGFTIVTGIAGRPRAARVLKAYCLGTIVAACRFARETPESDLSVEGVVHADRALVEARFKTARATEDSAIPPSRRSSRPVRILTPTNVQQEVARILGTTGDVPPQHAARAAAERQSRPSWPPPSPSVRPSELPGRPSGMIRLQVADTEPISKPGPIAKTDPKARSEMSAKTKAAASSGSEDEAAALPHRR